MRDASCGSPTALAQNRWNLTPSIDPTHSNLAADDKPEEQDECGVFGGQAALGLHAAPKLLVQPLNHIRGLERLPLALGELEEREQFLASLVEAPYHAGAAGSPLPLEGGEGVPGRREAFSIDDPMEVRDISLELEKK